MIKLSILGMLFLLFTESVEAQSPKKEYLEMLSSKTRVNLCVVVPFKNGRTNRFFLTTNNRLYSYFLHQKKIASVDYRTFLINIFQKKILIDPLKSGIHDPLIVKENLKIFVEYKTYGIDFIKKNYLDFLGDEWRNKLLDKDTIAALIKIMFDNNYVIWFSEYSGFYSIKHFAKTQ